MNWLARYRAHDDPAARVANTVALVVGCNGPFYPLYVWWLAPDAGRASLLTMLASPLFLSVPLAARRCRWAGPAMLVIVGLANTVWSVALLGPNTGVGLFVLPCVMLTLLIERSRLLFVGLALLVQQVVLRWSAPALSGMATATQEHLYALNASSVAFLMGFIVLSGVWSAGRK